MIDHYQPFLFPFFSFHSSVPSPLVTRYYYWSWEDGLWDLLRAKKVEKGSTLLVPNFYCSDVIENMRVHGYTVVTYRLDQHFQVKQQTLQNSIRKYHPAVVVLFHACGMTNPVVNKKTYIERITKKSILLEDCVHQLLDPSVVKPVNDSHFLMDSLRKVSPFYGSFLYGTKKGMQFQQTSKRLSLYTMKTSFLYVLFRGILQAAHIFKKPSLALFAHEQLLKRHDTIIGDGIAHQGMPLTAWMMQWMNREKLERVKREQVKWYEHMLTPIYKKSSPFYRIKIKRTDFGKLHVYPVGMKKKADKELLDFLKEKDIIVFPKFADSEWAKKRDVLFFPLGFHMDKNKIKIIAKTLLSLKTGEYKQAKVPVKSISPHLLVRAAELILSF